MFDRHEHQKTELHQNNRDGGDNVGRDKIIHNHLYGSVDYQRLLDDIRDREELLAGIAPDRMDLRLKQSKKLNDLKQQLEDFKADVFRLYELFTRIPINTERLRRAKEHFNKGEFREADAVLKAKEINAEVTQLQAEKKTATDRLAAIDQSLADRANEFLIKARIALLSPLAEGSSRFEMAEGWFEQALATARIAEVLYRYAFFLCAHNAFRRAEPLYQETLKKYRHLAKAEPKEFIPRVADTLNNLANLHSDTQAFGPAMKEYEEALKLYRGLAEAKPKASLSRVAAILNNLAILHSDTQAYGPARKEYEEALKLYRGFAQVEPKAFLPRVALILNNLGELHRAINDYSPALAKYEEALKLYRGFTQAKPKVFLPEMAAILNNLAILHQANQEDEPALKKYEEALKIRRGLAEADPKAFLPDVADTLNNLAILHSKTHEYGPARKEYEEALKLYRSLAQAEPKAFLPYLATILVNLSIFYLEDVPDKAKSVAYAQEARSILIPLCKQAPHLQGELDKAEQLLNLNNTKPGV